MKKPFCGSEMPTPEEASESFAECSAHVRKRFVKIAWLYRTVTTIDTMMTSIETFLFPDGSALALKGISLLPDQLVIHLAPWDNLTVPTTLVFDQATLVSLWADSDADDVSLPWDIIGVESVAVGEGLWRFVLHCQVIELIFVAAWPMRA